MDDRLVLKGRFTFQLIDDAKWDDKSLYVVVAYSTFIHFKCLVSDKASNLVRVLNPDELTETIQTLSRAKLLHLICSCHLANLVLEDLGREKAVLLAFQDEMSLGFQILRRRLINDHLPNDGAASRVLIIQDVK
jgi:hypothetical protein